MGASRESGYGLPVEGARQVLPDRVDGDGVLLRRWLVTDAAFSVPGIAHVEIHMDKANSASSGVPRRLGFRFLGETPHEVTAPAEVGIACSWRMDRALWQRQPGASRIG